MSAIQRYAFFGGTDGMNLDHLYLLSFKVQQTQIETYIKENENQYELIENELISLNKE